MDFVFSINSHIISSSQNALPTVAAALGAQIAFWISGKATLTLIDANVAATQALSLIPRRCDSAFTHDLNRFFILAGTSGDVHAIGLIHDPCKSAPLFAVIHAAGTGMQKLMVDRVLQFVKRNRFTQERRGNLNAEMTAYATDGSTLSESASGTAVDFVAIDIADLDADAGQVLLASRCDGS